MIELIDFMQTFGEQLLDRLWFPLLVWTALVLPLVAFLRWNESISPFYQYHSRVALMLTLPLGIAGSWLVQWINSGAAAAGEAAFFVIQKPIIISSAQPTEGVGSLSLDSPMLWLGILSLVLAVGTTWYLIKAAANYVSLHKLDHQLDFTPLADFEELKGNAPKAEPLARKTLVAFSNTATVPFTYGWKNTKIVIPSDLKQDTEALSMAVQHELMHIKHHDFLINVVMNLVKSIFWFHPLMHHLYNSGREYREITCDGEVLASNSFSRKKYASLLFELAKRDHQSNMAMSMAVNPSSLKKRIQIMSTYSNKSGTFRSSILLTLASAALIVLTISCTDMSENGITNTELEEVQKQISSKSDSGDKALYQIDGKQINKNEKLVVINGERWNLDDPEKREILSGLKSKYIKHLKVLKGEKAISEYGDDGKNGVIEMTVNNPDKAFSDLKETPSTPPRPSKVNTPENPSDPQSASKPFFIAVEEMPKLKGGLASLQQKITYPETAKEAGIEGRVIVRFIVNNEGDVENPEIIKGIGAGADKEALRVVKQAKFEPGKQRGEAVRVQYSLPITFKLADKKSDG